MDKLKVVYFGTPDFSVGCLEILHSRKDIEVLAVVTMPDRPAGRGKKLKSPPVAEFAKENGIRLLQTENVNKEESFLEEVGKQADFFLVVAFAQFLSQKVLDCPKIAPFNIHTSHLPKYRGAAPIQYALLNGDQDTAVTIQRMVKKMDAGDVAHTHLVKIDPQDNSETLFNKLKEESKTALNDFIEKVKSDSIEYIPQNDADASFAPVIKKLDGLIDFTQATSEEIVNKYRAFYPWPGLFFYLNDQRIKVLEVSKEENKVAAGELNTSFGTLLVGCKEGSIRLSKVQAEGKKPNTDAELINGFKNKYDSLTITHGAR